MAKGPPPPAPGRADPASETGCRHCLAPIRKRRSRNGDQMEWVSFAPSDLHGRQWPNEQAFEIGAFADPAWFSRFCHREIAEAMGGRRIQHAPIPIDNAVKLERWLET